jgi:hypothetical protein
MQVTIGCDPQHIQEMIQSNGPERKGMFQALEKSVAIFQGRLLN